MSLFSTTLASGLSDRLAAVVSTIKSSAVALSKPVTIPNSYDALLSADCGAADKYSFYQVVTNFNAPTYAFETGMSGVTLLQDSTLIRNYVNAFDTHCQAAAGVSFSTFCINSGLYVSEYFAEMYSASRGTAMTGRAVFAERDIVMAGSQKAGASNWTYRAGTALGVGTGPYTSSNTANQYVIAAMPSGVSATTSFSVSGTDDLGRTLYATASFTGVVNEHVVTSPAVRLRVITSVANLSDDAGVANGTIVEFKNKRERVIAI